MVGETGFEPATLCSQNRCATRLRYSPTEIIGFKVCLTRLFLRTNVLLAANFKYASPQNIKYSGFFGYVFALWGSCEIAVLQNIARTYAQSIGLPASDFKKPPLQALLKS